MNRKNGSLKEFIFSPAVFCVLGLVGGLAGMETAAEAACTYVLDDGRGAADLGHAEKGTNYFVVANWFPVTAGCQKINSITVYWASGTEFPVGHPIKLYLYEHPTGLANPAQAVKKVWPPRTVPSPRGIDDLSAGSRHQSSNRFFRRDASADLRGSRLYGTIGLHRNDYTGRRPDLSRNP